MPPPPPPPLSSISPSRSRCTRTARVSPGGRRTPHTEEDVPNHQRGRRPDISPLPERVLRHRRHREVELRHLLLLLWTGRRVRGDVFRGGGRHCSASVLEIQTSVCVRAARETRRCHRLRQHQSRCRPLKCARASRDETKTRKRAETS